MKAEGKLEGLRGLRILVVEDEFFIADELDKELSDAGAFVLGPVGSVADALTFLESDQAIDLALLDVNLRGERIFGVADGLRARGVPFAFATGYDGDALPQGYEDVPRLTKPVDGSALTAVLRQLLALRR